MKVFDRRKGELGGHDNHFDQANHHDMVTNCIVTT